MKQFDPAAEFAEADPVESFRGALKRGRSLLANGYHRHLNAAASRPFEHEKREIAVSGDQTPGPRRIFCGRGHSGSYFVKPRSATDSIKLISVWTSSE